MEHREVHKMRGMQMSEKSATSPKDIVRTLPSLKDLHDNTVNWSQKQLREYDDLLDSYRMTVYRILKLREELEAEEKRRKRRKGAFV
tara:strand:- start:269 stop:529 length:261 start_codon:yes stop_codon:yes gene_type:complete